MKYISIFWNHVKHYKYLIIIVIGLVYVGLIDSNSWLVRYKNSARQNAIIEEIEMYNDMHSKNIKILDAIENNPEAMKDIAREKYFMKEEDEDIFVLSDDK